MRRTIGLVIIGLVACGRGGGRAARDAAPPAPVAIDAAVTAPATLDAGVRERMDDHFGAVVRLQRALMRGELEQVRDEATYLIAHADDAGLEAWRPHVAAMTAAAAQVKDAPDLVAAAGLAANLGLQCRRCHTAERAIVAFAWEPVPASDGSVRTRMQRHAWAAARMWEGLIGPSDELWQLGASIMMGTELQALSSARPAADHDVADAIARVEVLAREAITAATPEAEAAVQGDLMASCVRCHQLVRDAGSPAGAPP